MLIDRCLCSWRSPGQTQRGWDQVSTAQQAVPTWAWGICSTEFGGEAFRQEWERKVSWDSKCFGAFLEDPEPTYLGFLQCQGVLLSITRLRAMWPSLRDPTRASCSLSQCMPSAWPDGPGHPPESPSEKLLGLQSLRPSFETCFQDKLPREQAKHAVCPLPFLHWANQGRPARVFGLTLKTDASHSQGAADCQCGTWLQAGSQQTRHCGGASDGRHSRTLLFHAEGA